MFSVKFMTQKEFCQKTKQAKKCTRQENLHEVQIINKTLVDANFWNISVFVLNLGTATKNNHLYNLFLNIRQGISYHEHKKRHEIL